MGEFECGSVVCGNVVYVGVCGCEGEWGGNWDREHVSLLILSTKNFLLLFLSYPPPPPTLPLPLLPHSLVIMFLNDVS